MVVPTGLRSSAGPRTPFNVAQEPVPVMKRLLVITAALQVLASGPVGAASSIALEQQIELQSVQGRIDHLAIDVANQRLFIAALGADSLEVVDLRQGKRTDRITGLHEPQGVLYQASSRRVLVANGSGGGVQAFADGKATPVKSVSSLDDADNIRNSPSDGLVYVGFGKSLAALDPDSLQILHEVRLAGHPEAFQIERSSRRIYVNVPTAGHVAVVDRSSYKVAQTWQVDGASSNFPMALDEEGHWLFVVARSPARLIAYETSTGRQVFQTASCGDADDVFFDAARHQLYVVCGDGQVDVLRQVGERFESAERVRTRPGARTGLFVPELSTLFVAAPARAGAAAEIRVYSVR